MCDTETTEGTANSYGSLKKPGRLQRRIPKNEEHEMEVEIEKVVKAQKEEPSLQVRLLTERNKLHTKKAGQRASRVVREGIRRESGC